MTSRKMMMAAHGQGSCIRQIGLYPVVPILLLEGVNKMKKRCPWCGKQKGGLVVHPTGSPFLAKCPFCHHLYGQNNHDKSMVIPGVLCIIFVVLCGFHSLFIIPVLLLLLVMISRIFTLPYFRMEKDKLTGRFVFLKYPSSTTYEARFVSSEDLPRIKIRDIYPTTRDFDHHICYTHRSPIQIVGKTGEGFLFQLLYRHPENPEYEAGRFYTIYVREQPYEIEIRRLENWVSFRP